LILNPVYERGPLTWRKRTELIKQGGAIDTIQFKYRVGHIFHGNEHGL
jgi:hypothetical protein